MIVAMVMQLVGSYVLTCIGKGLASCIRDCCNPEIQYMCSFVCLELFQLIYIAAILMLITAVDNSESIIKAFTGCITAINAVATILSGYYATMFTIHCLSNLSFTTFVLIR